MTGAPLEMRPLARKLQKQGYKVRVPLLAGHGGGNDELLASTWQDWLQGLKRHLRYLKSKHEHVFIAGLSVGALLGILLAAEESVDGLIILSVDLGYPGKSQPLTRHLLPLVYKIPFLRRHSYWTEKPPYGLKDKRLQRKITEAIEASKKRATKSYGLFRTYVESLYQAELLKKEVRKKASNVQCPSLIIHSMEDTMFSVKNATAAYEILGSREKKISLISGGDHVITVDLCKNEVAKQVGEFISHLTPQPQRFISIMDPAAAETPERPATFSG